MTLARLGLAAYNVSMLDLSDFLRQLSIWAIPGIFAITVHEVSHGYVARLLGDRTAEMVGRLTLNPLKHVDPMGTVIVPLIMLLLPGSFIFGWAKPVPVAQHNLRNPRRDMAIVAAAGPLSNIVMAVIWALVAKAGILIGHEWLTPWLVNVGAVGILFNLVLAVVNLLPVPPLDGGRVVSNLLPAGVSGKFDRIEPYGFMIIIGLLVFGVLGHIIAPPVYFLRGLILTVMGLG
ncbi:MAG: site-2 protease family protein [Lysobacterales bacterium]